MTVPNGSSLETSYALPRVPITNSWIAGSGVSSVFPSTTSAARDVPAPVVLSGTLGLAQAHEAQLLVGSKQALPAIIQAIDGARHVVNVEVFSIGPDGSGKILGDAMIRAAERGVEVNLVTDLTSLTAWPVPMVSFPLWARRLKKRGVNIKVTTRFIGSKALKTVTHRKVISVDGRQAFVGGMNFAKFMDGWHDAVFQLTGQSAAAVGADQLRRWGMLGGTITTRHSHAVAGSLHLARSRSLRPSVNILANSPELNTFQISDYYRKRIANAKTRIWVASPGFSDLKTVEALAAAAKRGVDVRIISPGTSPLSPLIKLDTRAALRTVLRAGGTVYEVPGISHLKAMVVDDEATLGSFNITQRSAKHDTEMNVQSSNPDVVGQIEQLFQRDMARSVTVNHSDFRGFGQTIADLLVDRMRISY